MEDQNSPQLPVAPVASEALPPVASEALPPDDDDAGKVDGPCILAFLDELSDGRRTWQRGFGVCSPSATNSDANELRELLQHEMIAIEWVVDVADNDNDFHIGTAYEFKPDTGELLVVIPDRQDPNPEWSGYVPLNYRFARLIEVCGQDAVRQMLFECVIQMNVIDVDWTVEWTDERGAQKQGRATQYSLIGTNIVVVPSSALHGDEEEPACQLIPVDHDLSMISAQDGKAQEVFERLMKEGVVANPKALPEEGPETEAPQSAMEMKARNLARIAIEIRSQLREALEIQTNTVSRTDKTLDHVRAFLFGGDLDRGSKLHEWAESARRQRRETNAIAHRDDLLARLEESAFILEDCWQADHDGVVHANAGLKHPEVRELRRHLGALQREQSALLMQVDDLEHQVKQMLWTTAKLDGKKVGPQDYMTDPSASEDASPANLSRGLQSSTNGSSFFGQSRYDAMPQDGSEWDPDAHVSHQEFQRDKERDKDRCLLS